MWQELLKSAPAALAIYAQITTLDSPIKETSNNKKQRNEIYSTWLQWKEEQLKKFSVWQVHLGGE